MTKTIYKVFCSLLIVLFTVMFLSKTVFAQDNVDNVINASEEFVLISEQGNEQYYISNNELLLVEVGQSEMDCSQALLETNGDRVKQVNADIKFYSTEINEVEREALLSPITRSGSLTASKQEMNSMGNIKATLQITYSYITIGSKRGLHLCKATGVVSFK